MKANLKISNRHVHLTKETYDQLFDEEMNVLKPLGQGKYFVSDKTLTLKTDNYEIKNVKIIGPFRNYDQIEISKADANHFKLNPPVRQSGDLQDAEKIMLVSEKASVSVKGCIIAQRHIHISPEDAQKYGLKDKQKVTLKLDGERSGMMDAFVKVTKDANLEIHIDTDESNAFSLANDLEIEIII